MTWRAMPVWGLASRDKTEATERLFVSLYEPVFKLCRHLVSDTSDAEDLLHETLILVLRALPNFRGEASEKTWVFRIAPRCAARRAQRLHRDVSIEGAVEIPSPASPAEEIVDARLRLERVGQALELLPLEQRSVLALAAVDGLSHAAIADVLGIPVGTVGSRLFQARKRLTEILRRKMTASGATDRREELERKP